MRPDRTGAHRQLLAHNRKIILATQSVCGICGRPVDKTIKPPHPMSPTIDHIIPIARNGHPSDLSNLQLAHRQCNRAKSDNLAPPATPDDRGNNNLPQSRDWRTA